jgi:hypothetical protein
MRDSLVICPLQGLQGVLSVYATGSSEHSHVGGMTAEGLGEHAWLTWAGEKGLLQHSEGRTGLCSTLLDKSRGWDLSGTQGHLEGL